MLVMREPVLFTSTLVAWWPETAEDVHALLRSSPLVSINHCTNALADSLSALAFRRKRVANYLIDLTASPEELRHRLSPTCRKLLNRAERLEHFVTHNEGLETTFRMVNEHLAWKAYRPLMSRAEWDRLLQQCDVFSICTDEGVMSTHVVLTDTERVRPLMSATADRRSRNTGYLNMVSSLNRALHWFELLHYRDRGVRIYDFGGITMGEGKPCLTGPLTFKSSFGAEPFAESCLRLTRSDLVRPALRLLWGSDRTRGVLGAMWRARLRLRAERPRPVIP
jgi:hypothetical protein